MATRMVCTEMGRLAAIEQKVDDLKESFKEHRNDMKQVVIDLEKAIDKIDEGKADAWVEGAFKWLLGISTTTMISMIGFLFGKVMGWF